MGGEKDQVRYGDYLSRISVSFQKLSYNAITPKPELTADGTEKPYSPPKVKLRVIDFYHILRPYIGSRLEEQLKAVVPLALYLVCFQTLVLRVYIEDPLVIFAGFVSVIGGLVLFMEGLKVGLMPLGEKLGDSLPAKASLPVFIIITFLIGVGVTFAEPAVGSLNIAGSMIKVENAPYLHALLNKWQWATVAAVGAGVGVSAVLGSLRFVHGWGLKPFILIATLPTLALTVYAMGDDRIKSVIGLAWDCGAVTTGPVTVPIVLSLGIGIARMAGKGDYPLSGFGIVTLASMIPVAAVLALAIYLAETVPAEQIIANANTAETSNSHASGNFFERPPFAEMLEGLQAVAPVVIFLLLIVRFVLREKFKEPQILAYGLTLTLLGMMLFSVGLTYGLSKLGAQYGALAPAAFTRIEGLEGSPLFNWWAGMLATVAFAGLLGFGATVAEPALSAIGMVVEDLTNGVYKKSFLIYSVSFGVGLGVIAGMLKIITGVPLAYLLIPGYALALILTVFSTEEFVNIAWDSAGVTTGEVTVPLVLVMGMGFSGALGIDDGFGILAMASLFPILTTLGAGLWIKWKISRSHL
ncbi:MAG: DUF1538 domain-containing protein [Nitrospinae bacterium]|nr:DUF1538 domain-containing protein [Nitrospinota bacterium]